MKCTYCHTELHEEEPVCEYCGMYNKEMMLEVSKKQQKNKKVVVKKNNKEHLPLFCEYFKYCLVKRRIYEYSNIQF